MRALSVKDNRKFEVRCRAFENGALHVGADSLSIHIGQRVRRDGAEQMWHSVSVYADETEDGNLAIRVLVSNPDWDEPLQVASIVSRPHDYGCRTALGCNLDHITCLPKAGATG